MRLPRSKALSANSVREVLARTPHRLDVELTGKTGDSVYALPDGGLLLIFSSQDGRGRLYESRDEFVAMYQHAEKLARRGPINPFRELLPQANFVSTVDDLVRQLPSALKLDAAILDKSEASLEAIDRVLRKMRTERVLTSAVFASLFAYVGEVMRLKTGGRWEMRLDSDGTTWMPWIVDSSGRSYAVFPIYKEIYEHRRSVSLRGLVAGILGAHLLRGPENV
jgi:hypothetical protein